MKLEGGGEVDNGPIAGIVAIAPPFQNVTAPATPKNATTHENAIPQIAPVDNLCDELFSISNVLFLLFEVLHMGQVLGSEMI